jgi:plastocyanin
VHCSIHLIIIAMKNLHVSKIRILASTAILFTFLIAADSCSKSTTYNTPNTGGTGGTGGSGGPGTNEVFIQGMAFNPSTITVTAGTTITWTNKDAVAHTATSKTNAFDSGNLGTGSTFSFTFATAGTYSYYCKVHPSMVASVTVN